MPEMDNGRYDELKTSIEALRDEITALKSKPDSDFIRSSVSGLMNKLGEMEAAVKARLNAAGEEFEEPEYDDIEPCCGKRAVSFMEEHPGLAAGMLFGAGMLLGSLLNRK